MSVAESPPAEDIFAHLYERKLGSRMREIRKLRGLSQSRLAQLAGVAKQTVSAWERGESPPQLNNLRRFCSATKVSMVQLWGNSSPDLSPFEDAHGRLNPASRLLTVYPTVSLAGNVLMHGSAAAMTDADMRAIVTVGVHPEGSVAFSIDNGANEPRFSSGDIVTLIPVKKMPARGSMVLAYIHELERYVFRRYLPRIDGQVAGAVLRALNDTYPDIELGRDDHILAIMGEHTSTRH